MWDSVRVAGTQGCLSPSATSQGAHAQGAEWLQNQGLNPGSAT